jgi:hypothetical protein
MRIVRSFRLLAVAVAVAFLGTASCGNTQEDAARDLSSNPPQFPLKLGPNQARYLVDQAGQPVFINGDTAWSLIAQLDTADALAYLDDRQARGVNLIIVNLIEHKFADHAPANADNVAPFTGRPFVTPNPAYFAHADAIIDAAAERHITVLLAPVYLGFACGSEGWCGEVQGATLAEMRQWGTFVGERYRDRDNIVWMIGGDTDPTPVAGKLSEVVAGILEKDDRHLMTAHNGPGSFAVDPWPNASWLAVNNVYDNQTSTMYQRAQTAYALAPSKPFFLLESAYENEHNSTPQTLRAQAYWSVTRGAMGHVFGNCPIWNFGSTAAFCNAGTWQANLASPGATSMTLLARLMSSRPWHLLLPDLSNSVLTGGIGSGAARATAARASDGATILAYLPTSRQVTVSLSVSGSTADAWWFNPATGVVTSLGSFAAGGSLTVTPPAAGDWVLVVDDAARGFGPPGQVDDTTDTTVTFEDLNDGTALAGYAGITWAPGWRIWDGGAAFTRNAFIDSTAGDATATLTLPAGTVLRSFKVGTGSGAAATVRVTSAGNPERLWTDVGGGYQVKSLNWTAPSTTVTIRATCGSQWGASDLAFDDLMYGPVDGGNGTPTVSSPAAASPSTVTGTITDLSVLGADDGGEAGLSYTWTMTDGPPGATVTFAPNGTNAAKSAVGTFSMIGSYTLRVTMRDAAGAAVASSAAVTVQQTATSLTIAPASLTVAAGGSGQFTGTVTDQFGRPLVQQPNIVWSVSGGGAISGTGRFFAGAADGGPFTVSATSGALQGNALVTVAMAPPPPDVVLDFETLADGTTLVSHGGVSWGSSPAWRIWDGGVPFTRNAFIDSISTSEVAQTFTLPTGQVLKSLEVAVPTGTPATLRISSPGNPERTWTDLGSSYQTLTLGWTVAAPVVTVRVTCGSQWGASDLAFDDVVFGSP